MHAQLDAAMAPLLHSPKRWAVADIDYVRQHHSTCTVRQIAEELKEPVTRVRKLVCYIKKGGHSVSDRQVANADTAKSVHLRSSSPDAGWVDASAATCPAKALIGPLCAPPDLMAFVRVRPVREAATCLNLSRGTVHNLQKGYWPADPRKILQGWDAYKGRSVQRATSWFIRRVTADGLRHGGKLYQAPQLAGRAGELLAVARAADGGLLAQALELPVERFTLAVKG